MLTFVGVDVHPIYYIKIYRIGAILRTGIPKRSKTSVEFEAERPNQLIKSAKVCSALFSSNYL